MARERRPIDVEPGRSDREATLIAGVNTRPDRATVPNVITAARLVLVVPVVVGVVGVVASRQHPVAATVLLVLFATRTGSTGSSLAVSAR